jgi:hypothetical protein
MRRSSNLAAVSPSSRAGQKPGPYGFSSDIKRQSEPVGICRNHLSPASGGASISSATPAAICVCSQATKQSRSRSEPKLPICSHGKFIARPPAGFDNGGDVRLVPLSKPIPSTGPLPSRESPYQRELFGFVRNAVRQSCRNLTTATSISRIDCGRGGLGGISWAAPLGQILYTSVDSVGRLLGRRQNGANGALIAVQSIVQNTRRDADRRGGPHDDPAGICDRSH